MTPPMTPREKVELKPCPFCGGSASSMSNGRRWQTSCTECHAGTPEAFDTEELSAASWNRLTALASGSGDHAELARLAEWRDRLRADPGRAAHFGSPYADKPMQNGRTYWNIDLADDITTLLAENAALREENGGLAEAASRSEARLLRASEAERKLAEAVATLEVIANEDSPFDVIKDNLLARISKDLGRRIDLARTFLSKEAERG